MTTHPGSCHCGKIVFEAEGELTTAIDCNCSLCRRRGSLLAFVPRADFRLNGAREDLSVYTFNQHRLKHYFCDVCGVAPFSEGIGPDGKEMTAINLRCVPDVDVASLTIRQWDGASH
ncbi:MAG: GFA family protein [Asticcacaulis sp.]|uniref:GFA family protein n=1 Tax=Asticcacaulis sp. TaxID=1872648 RepID=UPI0025C4D2CE|nr:GFA family protein [Asticcacaulis sp.]MCA1935109.1 GFA family protein [Asticcacaulis sp.]